MNTRIPFVAAPLLVTAYGLLRLADGANGDRGPGLAWTAGHAAFLAAIVLFAPVLLEMRRRAGGGALATATAAVGLAGAACALAQIGIDLAVGTLAADHADMGRRFDDVQSVPGVTPVVYTVGPALFYVALTVVLGHLAVRREVPAWAPVVLFAGVAASVADLDLLPVAGLLFLAALVPLVRRVPARHAAGVRAGA
ncbi:hypothetical protein [Actinomadura verrucosospora]|uniref:Uncharacterized protein n=1 Tax=Actinomadura verrucosospora TaxID=46165 RepID=A0A7D3ZNP7_ACTVE|nr:hypothetical protein [Actinomadura verrucosospora]QKG25041.1 hypothetical protein ACTIVE_6692 [Actinomadura verrucosospora]